MQPDMSFDVSQDDAERGFSIRSCDSRVFDRNGTTQASSTTLIRASNRRKRLRFTTMGAEDDESHPTEPGMHNHNSPRPPGTPNIVETAHEIRRTLSLASIDHLLLLSSNPAGERERFVEEISRAGKDMVWRAEGEPTPLPSDGERAAVLAVRRALRSFVLAFCVRAGVNAAVLLLRGFRRRSVKLSALRHALLGKEPLRFASMIGSFTFLNTLTLHLLRLAPPLAYFRRRLRLPLQLNATFGPPQREGSEGERRWQAAAAGAVASLSLLCEAKPRRKGVAQQMFVRGLQASYNMYAPHVGVHIPHGDILVFGFCCGQIMYSWLLSPDTIPPEYRSWILSASRVPAAAVVANRSLVRTGKLDEGALKSLLSFPSVTRQNRHHLMHLLENRTVAEGVPCAVTHPWNDSCQVNTVERFFSVFKLMLPVYSALHIIPSLVLRWPRFRDYPLSTALRLLAGIGRSCSFLGIFVCIFQGLLCLRTNVLDRRLGPDTSQVIRSFVKGRPVFWLLGFLSCLSLLVEEKRRRAELAMYVLPKALESAWSSARRKAWVPKVPFGESVLGAIAMAMVMDAYKHRPEALSGLVRRLMYQLIGPV